MRIFSIALMLLLSSSLMASGMGKFANFGSNPGNLTMYTFVPENVAANAPVVVALHGCTQTASEFNERSGWSKLAEELGFIVIFPEQKSANNPMMCFNWGGEYGDQDNITRGYGENKSVIEMIDTVKSQYSVDSDRVFIVGFSAGAAMTANMLAMYPDVFKAGSIMAGIPYRCATDLLASFTCMYQGKSQSAEAWGNLVRNAFDYEGEYPQVSIWHGTSDYVVTPKNATELVKQWSNVHGVSAEAQTIDLGDSNAHSVYRDGAGKEVIRLHKINGMGHAITVNPGDEFSGGSTGSYGENRGIHSTVVTAKEWGLY